MTTEPPASIDVECGHMDLASIVQAHTDRGYRCVMLEVKRGAYRIAFARITPSGARVVTQTGEQAG